MKGKTVRARSACSCANLRPVKLLSTTRLVLPFCRVLRRGKENNRVKGKTVRVRCVLFARI